MLFIEKITVSNCGKGVLYTYSEERCHSGLHVAKDALFFHQYRLENPCTLHNFGRGKQYHDHFESVTHCEKNSAFEVINS
jgi:hypothetical protein